MNFSEIKKAAESKHSLHVQQKAAQDKRFQELEKRCKKLEMAMKTLCKALDTALESLITIAAKGKEEEENAK